MNSKYDIGKKIKEKRLSLNMTMEYVATKSGITRATLSAIENCSLNCSIKNLISVLDVLDMKINIETNEKKGTNRERATRTNTLLDKKINRFVIMCVEQYASFKNENSNLIYKKLFDKGIINCLKEDYEDLHGMSLIYLNEYIDKLAEVDV